MIGTGTKNLELLIILEGMHLGALLLYTLQVSKDSFG